MTSLFRCTEIAGLRNRVSGPTLMFDNGRGDCDDKLDALLDACTAAVRPYASA